MMRIVVLLVGLVVFGQVATADEVASIDARVLKIEIVGGSKVLTCAKGLQAGITKHWTAKVLVGGKPVADATVVVVDKGATTVKTSATFESKNLDVRFSPPPSP